MNIHPNLIVQANGELSQFLSVLGATQLQYQLSNTSLLDRLFEPEHLPNAAKEAYVLFSTQLINQLRPLASATGNSTV